MRKRILTETESSELADSLTHTAMAAVDDLTPSSAADVLEELADSIATWAQAVRDDASKEDAND